MKKQYSVQLFREISGWFKRGITNWAQADTLGMWILPYLIEKSHVTEKDFKSWLKSPFSFQRRCVPVTYIKSLKKLNSPLSLFTIIEPLMSDNVREVQQGTGWFLREAWKLFPEETEQFLLKWKDSSPRLIYQYACEKMVKDYRKKFSRKKA
jgi:3-methyladenine DNA glycosylase AlkD